MGHGFNTVPRSRIQHRPRIRLRGMRAEEFRRLALALPDVAEGSHMQHPDFRVGGRIFATLGAPGPEWGMVQLTPEEQEVFVAIDPEGFRPVPGGWGLKGATNVRLAAARKAVVRDALAAAWKIRVAKNTTPKSKPSGRRPRKRSS